MMLSNSHAVVVHHIAQLTFFCYRWLVLCRLMRMVFYQMLVGGYHYLSCNKADQDNPGVNDMAYTFFQNSFIERQQ